MPKTARTTGRISLYPLTPEQAISSMFKISRADVKRIIAKRPGKKRKR